MVRTFLNHGANVNHKCAFAQTPLHHAALTVMADDPYLTWEAEDVVDLLLRSGADETIVDDDGLTTCNIANKELREFVEEEDDPEERAEHEDVVRRVRKLLANAPADKAWRRRGFWALCRAHPDRLQKDLLGPEDTGTSSSNKRSTRDSSRALSETPEVDLQSNRDNWADAAVRLLRLGEEVIFRAIVGFL